MGWREKLRHAFSVESAAAELTSDDKALLDRMADWLLGRKMEAPALMFLESVRPLRHLGSQALVFFQPYAAFVFSKADCERFTRLLESRNSVDYLVHRLEKPV